MKRIVLLLALISAGSCVASIWQVQATRARPSADALIIANRITKKSSDKYRAELLLQYSFAGRSFREWQIEGKSSLKRSHIEALLGERAPGSHIQIFADPENPKQRTTTPTGWQAYLGAILCGILSLAAAIAAQVVYLN